MHIIVTENYQKKKNNTNNNKTSGIKLTQINICVYFISMSTISIPMYGSKPNIYDDSGLIHRRN